MSSTGIKKALSSSVLKHSFSSMKKWRMHLSEEQFLKREVAVFVA